MNLYFYNSIIFTMIDKTTHEGLIKITNQIKLNLNSSSDDFVIPIRFDTEIT